MSLYLYQNDQRTGPFSEDQVSQMLRAGIISPETLGWKEGLAGWERISALVSTANTTIPPAPAVRKSPLGLISFVCSLVTMVGWAVLLAVAGIAHNNGTATESFNVIVGLFLMGGIVINFIALVLGFIGIFQGRPNTLAILGASLNGFLILALIGLVCLGLAMKN